MNGQRNAEAIDRESPVARREHGSGASRMVNRETGQPPGSFRQPVRPAPAAVFRSAKAISASNSAGWT